MWKNGKSSTPKGSMANGVSFFAEGFSMVGDLNSVSDVRVEGTIEGNISTRQKVVVGKTGRVIGKINAANLCVMGQVIGEVFVTGVTRIEGTGSISGLMQSGGFDIEPGAWIEANIRNYRTSEDSSGTDAVTRNINEVNLSSGRSQVPAEKFS